MTAALKFEKENNLVPYCDVRAVSHSCDVLLVVFSFSDKIVAIHALLCFGLCKQIDILQLWTRGFAFASKKTYGPPAFKSPVLAVVIRRTIYAFPKALV